MSIGLKVPRPAIRVVSENNELRLYELKTEKDCTREMTPMLLVKSYRVRFHLTYLLEQTYFKPYPEDLITLEDSEKVEI